MSVMIKGMEIPSGCYDCPILQSSDGCFDFECPFNSYLLWHNAEDVIRYRPDSCPLVEVPTPHGRLIDADKLVWFIDNHIAAGKKWVEFETIKDMINSLPTIIEAEVMSIVILGVDAPKKPECRCIDNEQRTKYAICRPYDGITLNTEVEFLLDHNGNVMLFDSESAAWEYLKPFGITEEEPNVIKVVEYKEGDLITDRECNDIWERNDDCPLEEVSE